MIKAEVSYVTGANGFVGSHLVTRLESPRTVPHAEIDALQVGDFDNFYFLSTYGNMYEHTEADKIVKANVSDLVNVLRQVDTDKGFKSFVFISSSSVKLKRQTMYSRMKRAAEEVLLAYTERFDLPICVIRPFSVTGVGEQPQHLIPTLIRSCMTGERMDFVPEPVHDFIDVDDVVEGILNLAGHSAKGIFELGTGHSYSNQEVLEVVERVTGKKANVNVVRQMRDYDNKDWASMNYRARMYGWLPKKTLVQSVTEMVGAYER